jgi:hypothetical protein
VLATGAVVGGAVGGTPVGAAAGAAGGVGAAGLLHAATSSPAPVPMPI